MIDFPEKVSLSLPTSTLYIVRFLMNRDQRGFTAVMDQLLNESPQFVEAQVELAHLQQQQGRSTG